ncbi:MAG: hypothetical protein VKJ24_09315 [Synechococcales bacterium]|nr:hypothetical protein [Synechococcales bacterium]
MDAFTAMSPDWTATAVHAKAFCCPTCGKSSLEAETAWVNRRSPVYSDDPDPRRRRKWQEFYQCGCGCVWWAWSSDRPPTELNPQPAQEGEWRDRPFYNPFDEL